MNRILNLGKVKLTMHRNGFPKGFVMKRKLFDSEAKVMEIIWEKSPISAKDIS